MKQRKNQLIIIIIVLFISGFLVASLTSFFAARSSLRSQITQSELPLTGDNIYSEIQHDLINPVFIIFDIDNFKETNDAFGHIAGDSVLKDVAKTARGNIRIPDALFRWGGEEFLIILKECGLDHAFDVAEKIRKAVANSPTLHKNKKIPTTISLGVAQYLHEESVDVMLSRIDKALYSAKHNGRDRTEKAL